METIKEATKKDYTERMLKVFTYIQQHLDEDVRLETLAEEACFSPYHFHRIFHGLVGESVKEHIRRIKLERAAARLKQTDWQIIQIALEAGYEAHEAFSRAFRQMFKMSPTQYRAANQPFSASPANVHYHPDGRIIKFNPWKKETQPVKAEIVELQPVKVAFVRHVGPYDQCGKAWEKLCTWAGPKGYFQPGVRFIGLCYDDPDVTPPDKIRYDACITVDDSCKPDGQIGIQTIAGGLYARTIHEGSYKKLSQTYAALCGRWIPQNGCEIRSLPGFEVYLNDPNSTPENELLTDVHVPVERK
jgi:AraC family transcriptional regulator